jgi:hypothetical protein
MPDEETGIRKDTAVAYVKVRCWYLTGGTEESHVITPVRETGNLAEISFGCLHCKSSGEMNFCPHRSGIINLTTYGIQKELRSCYQK